MSQIKLETFFQKATKGYAKFVYENGQFFLIKRRAKIYIDNTTILQLLNFMKKDIKKSNEVFKTYLS